MIKTVTIVSLSRGMLGEDFARHELEIGVRRLEEYGLRVKFGRHALTANISSSLSSPSSPGFVS